MMEAFLPAILMGLFGLVIGIGLGIAAKKFEVKTDPRVKEILSVLSGANCGACGFAGCEAYANAVVNKGAPHNKCLPGGKGVAEKIDEIMKKNPS